MKDWVKFTLILGFTLAAPAISCLLILLAIDFWWSVIR